MIRTALVALLVGTTVLSGGPPAQATGGGGHGTVLINEIANGGQRSDSDSFFELRNWGDDAVDLTGWSVYRCSAMGLRANTGRTEGELAGVILKPGEIFTFSKVGMAGDQHTTQPFSSEGVGLWLENPEGERVDAVAVYPNEPWQTQTECTFGRNLPNSLDFSLGESWQRVAATGDQAADFVKAPATIAGRNATRGQPRASSNVVISELTGAGPDGPNDDFVELQNTGTVDENISGWQLFRCTAEGRLRENTRQLVVENGTVLRPGERWVAASQSYRGRVDATYRTPLANIEFGVLLRTSDDRLVDRVSVATQADSACQDGDDKLPAVLDAVAGESHQRTADGFIIAPRTPGRANATIANSILARHLRYPATRGVALSEIGTDPAPAGQLPGMRQRNFIELSNFGATRVDIGGWTLRRCELTGSRSPDLQATVPAGTVLEPGKTWLAARAGTDEAGNADATYDTALNFLGAGIWVEDARGIRVDSAGIYAANEMDSSNVTDSPCTKGVALTTYGVDRMLGETFQRTAFTGDDATDFVAAKSTPGSAALVEAAEPITAAQPLEIEGATVRPVSVAEQKPLPATDGAARVIEAWAGASDGPLVKRTGPGERRLDASKPVDAIDDGWLSPYQRLVIDATKLRMGSSVVWRGSSVARNELQLSVWDWSASTWRLLDAGSGAGLSLGGVLGSGDIRAQRVTLLVQDGPRIEATLLDGRDGALAAPEDYDFAISHLTDTQYLSESYPEVYAGVVGWIAQNADDRKIAFATHTGDLVQNWVDPDQNEVRARREFETASKMQAVLDAARVPNSVLPGNHDNKRGVDDSLFNEYFGPERYAGTEWYGGSIAPDDNSANFSTFERGGARFLMLSLPYAYGEREIAWAEQVVTSHPGHNVVISTHEHVTPKTEFEKAHRSSTSRWVSRGQELWDRVIAPNRNVTVVLSGHFHGIGSLVTENAGDIEGHTVVELLADYQEFRTHTGERATGFQRLLQLDLDAGTIAVDTFSVRLAANASHEYDYKQFVADNGTPLSASNARPWRIIESGLQGRYSATDDEFQARVTFQHPKRVHTAALEVGAVAAASSR
ncbi:hypothetical protein EYE40_00795 [Glaciihabitans arcticus]|uniref:LTD domain-containing protein n=1 Tax=Glaciihabitans arcticus TaxID=2668039 RepID=A0A4Q9GV43_9MICO|nr:lamin tail domain-containing protein [Glaciihabitans arcticus]TBN56050.1 hypothetical protein EYE40_00795 [Glaciihabitans arcticus]